MPIYSKDAIDYEAGFNITDCITGEIYTDEEAHQQTQEVKSRLILRPRKIGCYVMTMEKVLKCKKKM